MLEQRPRRSLGIRSTAADREYSLFRLEHIAVAGNHQRMLFIRDRQHGLESPQHAIGAPVLGELDSAAQQIALMFFQLRLEALKKSESIGGTACEAGEDPLVIK